MRGGQQIRRARFSAASIVGALVASSITMVFLSESGSTWREVGLAVLSGGVVGGSLVVVESMLARAEDDRRSHDELVRLLSVTAGLNGIDLTAVDLTGIYLPNRALVAAQAARATLAGAKLLFGNFRHANLSGADLRGADLSGATLAHATLQNADLRKAVLDDVDLSRASLRDADLSGVRIDRGRLIGTDLTGVDLSGATIANCYLMGADFTGATLTGVVIQACEHDERTRWPTGYSPEPSAPVVQEPIGSMDIDEYLVWKASRRPGGSLPGPT